MSLFIYRYNKGTFLQNIFGYDRVLSNAKKWHYWVWADFHLLLAILNTLFMYRIGRGEIE